MARQTYSPRQLERYFDHIRLPSRFRPRFNVPASESRPSLEFLHRLQRYQLASVPWENLSKFYNAVPGPIVPLLGGDQLFEKIVERASRGKLNNRGGRGGGCYENNTFFGNVLRSLGYDVYSGAARVHMGHEEGLAWGHMVNFVSVDGRKFMVDVGFGAPGPIQPLPLQEAIEHSNILPATVRLLREPLTGLVDRSQKLWIYQHRSSTPDKSNPHPTSIPSNPSSSPVPLGSQTGLKSSSEGRRDLNWMNVYSFSEVEFTPRDFQTQSIASSYRRDSFFNWTIAAARMILADEVPTILSAVPERTPYNSASPEPQRQDCTGDDDIVGVMTLTTTECKCLIRGVSTTLRTFKDEDDRLDALKMYFGIEFSDEERMGLSGTVVAFDRVQF